MRVGNPPNDRIQERAGRRPTNTLLGAVAKPLGAAALLGALVSTAVAGNVPAAAQPPKVDLSGVAPTANVRNKGPDGRPHPVQARLFLDRTKVAPGESARFGLLLTQDTDWHTYWKSPGDIGMPTTIAWKLPQGVSASPHEYPRPLRFDQDGIVSYGYSDEVLLIGELSVAASASPGVLSVEADASWLVCEKQCIPGGAHLVMPVEVGAGGAPTPMAPLFDWTVAQHPVDAAKYTDRFTVTSAVTPATLTPNSTFKAVFEVVPAAGTQLGEPPASGTWPAFLPIATAPDWMIDSAAIAKTEGGGWRIEVNATTFEPQEPPKTDNIGGQLAVQVGEELLVTEVSVPLPWAASAPGVAPAPEAAPPTEAAPAPPPKAAVAAPTGLSSEIGAASLLMNLLLGFVGGLILNVMPCVLPVLTLKLYGLVEHGDLTAGRRRLTGVAYGLGVLASFWAMAAAIIGSRALLGLDLDWGSQFQYPPYVAGLATVVFAFGLSLFGVFEIPVIGGNAAAEASSRDGLGGSFLTGVFATLLATPCSAPFLGSAVAYALGAPTLVLLAIFTAVGAGLAAPFVLVAFVPAAFKLLPQPGEWMDTFKQLLGFTLIGTTVWLVDVLMAQLGSDGATRFLIFLTFVGAACWVIGRFGGLAETRGRQIGAGLVAILLLGVGGSQLSLQVAAAETCDDGTSLASELDWSEGIPWQPFSEARVASLSDKVVFLDFTADWCVSCKVNERTVLETATSHDAMKRLGVVPLKADWTRSDPVITEWLHRNGRAGVPMYLVLPPGGGEPLLLPEVITPTMVVEALEKAATGHRAN